MRKAAEENPYSLASPRQLSLAGNTTASGLTQRWATPLRWQWARAWSTAARRTMQSASGKVLWQRNRSCRETLL